MDKYIFDESNGLWYELQGDYYIPCLILSEEETQPIGLWGQRHKQYLKEHKQFLYTTMLIEGIQRHMALRSLTPIQTVTAYLRGFGRNGLV